MPSTCSSICKDSPKEIPSYGDIGGIGITLAFLITAWMVVILLVVYYLVAFDPELDPFRKENARTRCLYPNPIDCTIRQFMCKLPGFRSLLRTTSPRSQHLESALNKCVLMFADIQIFTGLAILISGYISLGCDIVPYHWQYMIYLAWLASVTHLASLSFLRNYLANNFRQCIWRLIAMCLIQILLSVAVGFAAHFNGDEWLKSKGGRPAACYFRGRIDAGSGAFQSSIKIIVLLVWGFAIRIAKMFPAFEGRLRKIAAQLQDKSKGRQYGDADDTTSQEWDPKVGRRFERVRILIWEPFVIASYAVLSIQLDFFTSFLAEVYWLLFTVIWITSRLIKLRVGGPPDDNKWAFGQILPLILLVAPLVSVLEPFLTRLEAEKPLGNISSNQSDTDSTPGAVRDLEYANTISYQGLFLLTALSYIDIGVYFVLGQEDTQGIIIPLIQLLFTMLLLNPMLQLLWVICTLWVPKMSWSNASKKAAYDSHIFGLTTMSLVANFLQSDLLLSMEAVRPRPRPTPISKARRLLPVPVSLGIVLFGYLFLVLLFVLNLSLRNQKWWSTCLLFLLPVSFLLIRLLVYAPYGFGFFFGYGDIPLLLWTAGFLTLELVIYGLEVLAEQKAAPKLATCLRYILMVSVSASCFLYVCIFDYTVFLIFVGSLTFSFHMWVCMGASFSRRRSS